MTMPKTHAGSRALWGGGLLAGQLGTQPVIYVHSLLLGLGGALATFTRSKRVTK